MAERKKRMLMVLKTLVLLGLMAASMLFASLEPLSLISLKSTTPGLSFKEHESVNFYVCLFFIAFLLPPLQYFILLIGGSNTNLYNLCLESYLGCTFTFLVTNIIKWCVGRERPDYADRIARTIGQTRLEAKRSFPSGHSSMSFAAAFYLAYESSLAIKKVRSNGAKAVLIYMGIVVPLGLAGIVAYTRILDHKHDVIDVTVGSLLGLFIPYSIRNVIMRERRIESMKNVVVQ
ncbi:diacylglycerol diphosphate phosphatase / phosphatidate phosphatase [Nematocida minor]|uniref:diacylglycerol diphosphate phosphatase / phosphatidate phosphatase n=1 Tax=Nematocida minor TaxID=1912983 RepID=UPI00221F3794|nr:diacylglycerol diphosphate phosphatase / phosphatidate phosphatase [Nematocida minor]KAI5191837.1 diacylglycerol diphosphate phosphatase / phosphatidate phosphatase [Nematocida minor]